MSYTPTEWKAGDTVTSAKLNKMEQGIAGGSSGALIVNYSNELTDKTWQEIYDAILNGQTIYLKDNRSDDIDIAILRQIRHSDDSNYYAMFDYTQYVAFSADDYLTIDG